MILKKAATCRKFENDIPKVCNKLVAGLSFYRMQINEKVFVMWKTAWRYFIQFNTVQVLLMASLSYQ